MKVYNPMVKNKNNKIMTGNESKTDVFTKFFLLNYSLLFFLGSRLMLDLAAQDITPERCNKAHGFAEICPGAPEGRCRLCKYINILLLPLINRIINRIIMYL